ncbi:MAG: hypothetical protein PVI82_12595 [Desulfobacterales bacterium]|jgi:hypothetical protein
MMPISKINFFQPGIWENGAFLKEIERNLAIADDHFASGRWKPAIESRVFEKYKATLGGRPIESFDPDGYLAELDLGESLTAGRSNIELLHAFHLIQEYRPDPRYFPLAKNIGAFVQNFFLSTSRVFPAIVNAVDRLIDPLAVKLIERNYQTDRYHTAPYGRIEEIIKGDRSDLPKEVRYLGILRQKEPQFAWDRGPHSGSIDPGRRANENFGTYDIALKFGFCEAQARRIATKCYDVDISQTHYHDPHDRTKLRITGTVGEIGDIQRHYNRSPAGVEDTRITAAKIHLERALLLAEEGFYDAAEQEFAIGLHSLQDIFSHAQLTPFTHTFLGEFPDLVKYHPLSMFETAVATEGYFKKFIAGLNLKPIEQPTELQTPTMCSGRLVVGNAAPEEKSRVSQKLAEFPKGLTAFLNNNGICVFVGAEGTKLTELGFGTDLDGDGKIMPGKWVDVNKDGKRQWFEMEDQFAKGKKWDRQPAAYNHYNRMIFIAGRFLKEPVFESLLKHEINHAIDLTCRDNPQLKHKWNAYIDKLYNAARRQGTIAFDELDPHEYFARIEQQ